MSAHCSFGTVHGISERSLRAYSLFMFMCGLSLYVDEGDYCNNDGGNKYSEAESNKQAATNKRCHLWGTE
jgi:hypothetical protein